MYEQIVATLRECNGNKAEAARKLKLAPTTLKDRLAIYERHGGNIPVAPRCNKAVKEVAAKRKPQKHCVIPDVQAKPGVPLDHLRWAGEYIAEKKPDTIICIGDFADMASLSSYDRGTASAENKRYQYDLEAAHKAMELLMTPIVKEKDYKPRLVLTLGNHEDRINRYGNDNPALNGHVSVKDLGYEAWGWEVHPFKEVVKIDGISYTHFFYNHNTGKPYGGENLDTRLKTIGMSFTMGHQQGLKTAMRELADGTRQRGMVCGSFYQHNEDYRGPQARHEWRGILIKHEVQDGNYDLMEVSMNYLRKRYA